MSIQARRNAVEPTALISPDDIHVLDQSTKIAIRMKAGVERIVPSAFVGLALTAGALPASMYVTQYGQYRDLEGKLQGELKVLHEDDDNVVVMPERLSAVEEEAARRPKPEDTTPEATMDEILAAIDKVLKVAAGKPDSKARYLTSDGIPKVPAIEEFLGKNITAKQRDAAWASINSEDTIETEAN